MTKKVFVLGAGFSKAIEGAMPLMTELHTEVFERLKDWEYFPKLEKINSRINGDKKDLEKLLSFLAEKQIWQDYSESNEHNTLYEKLKEEISKVIEQKEREFKILKADDWILKLFLNIIGQNIDIITFNYDQLVEKIIYHFPMPSSDLSGSLNHLFIKEAPMKAIMLSRFGNRLIVGHDLYEGRLYGKFKEKLNFLYFENKTSKNIKLDICVSKIEFIKISLIYNSSYQKRMLKKKKALERNIDVDRDYYRKEVDEKKLNEILPEAVYEERFIKENGATLSNLGISNEDTKQVASTFRKQFLYILTFEELLYEEIDKHNKQASITPAQQTAISPAITEAGKKLEQLSKENSLYPYIEDEKQPHLFPIHLKQIIRFPINHISERSDREKEVFDPRSNPLTFDIKAQLFKLHGSVNWYTKPNFGNYYYVPHYDDKDIYTTELTDLQRLIVPPVANKSNLYEDSLFGAIWKGAYEKIKEADEVYFLGYSLPETDLQAKYLFQTGIKKYAKIFVVNKKGEENKYKNTFAGFANLNVQYCTADENPIKTFAENHEGFYS